jgi:hypothetical protein
MQKLMLMLIKFKRKSWKIERSGWNDLPNWNSIKKLGEKYLTK